MEMPVPDDSVVPNLARVPYAFFQDETGMCALVPEWLALRFTCEMNGWHFGESTMVHTLQVITEPRTTCLRHSAL